MKHLLPIIMLGACVPDVPETPSFQEHVLPILAANCVRCHGVPTLDGAPNEFRLDSFEDTLVSDGTTPPPGICGVPDDPTQATVICGARQYALLIGSRLRNEKRPMPPRFPLEEDQIETLSRWVKKPERGLPHPGNQPPTLVVDGTSRAGSSIDLDVRVDDPDRDLVVGTLFALVEGRRRLVGGVRSGRVQVTWDITGVPAGSYPLTAELDDGSEVYPMKLGALEVGP